MTGQKLEEIRKKMYSVAEDSCYGWSRWSPNAAWRTGFEAGVDSALETVSKELGIYEEYHFGTAKLRTAALRKAGEI